MDRPVKEPRDSLEDMFPTLTYDELADMFVKVKLERDDFKEEVGILKRQLQRAGDQYKRANNAEEERDQLRAECERLKSALEYAAENMCKHRGEVRPGSGRDWCLECNSWVYLSDREHIRQVEAALEGE